MADTTLPVSLAAEPEFAGNAAEPALSGTAAASASNSGGRGMRQRKAGPPMLSSGPPIPPAGKAKPKAAKPQKKKKAPGAAAGKAGKAGRAAASALNAEGDEDTSLLADYSADGAILEDDESGQVFCVCLGHDDGRPMLGCESCDNW